MNKRNMNKYKLDELLKAAASFATEKSANKKLEASLRKIEAEKQGIKTKDVTEVTYDSLAEAIGELTMCQSQVLAAILSKFSALGFKPIEEVASHFAFGEHWNELPEYAGYVPEQYNGSWQSLKDLFYKMGTYSNERPAPVNIRRDDRVICVNVYGFRVPDAPPVIALGTDAATRGRIVFCKDVITKQYIAIAW